MTRYEKSLITLEYEITSLVRVLEALNQRRNYPLERAHYLLLLQLRDGPLSIGELAATLLLDNSTVTRQVNAMLKRNLIEKLPNPNDGRSALVSVTKKGRDQVETMNDLRLKRLQTTLADWSDGDKQGLADLCNRFIQDLVAHMEKNAAPQAPEK